MGSTHTLSRGRCRANDPMGIRTTRSLFHRAFGVRDAGVLLHVQFGGVVAHTAADDLGLVT